ncbi:MAG: thioredoxin family protein [Actinomycetia bacterium]|nr:thioredoxin family protein [Actinomycetes bacterium]
MTGLAKQPLPEGVVAVVKRDCPTCELVAPVLDDLARRGLELTVFTQDDPLFPEGSATVVDDTQLAMSWSHDIETVPTMMKVQDGQETERIVGWSRSQWEAFTGQTHLGPDLPEQRPGCGSLSCDPSMVDLLTVRFSGSSLTSRRIELARLEDEIEAGFDRGWSDGLPVVPPTEARVLRMLEGTTRQPDEVIAIVPPDLNEVTVEQIAINAVLAGAKPEYLPVILTAVEAACTDEFNMHGLIATTFFSGPILIVNGPITNRIGMNSGANVLGQGNRANLTIGRTLQLVVRNLGGGRPPISKTPHPPDPTTSGVSPDGQTPLASAANGIDMALMGSPSKLGLCFAEREFDSPFDPLATHMGLDPGVDAVTIYAGQGPTAIVDQLSRTPESLARSMAGVLAVTFHPKLVIGFDAMLVVGPEHGRIFRQAGWDRARLSQELDELLTLDSDRLLRGVDGIDEGLPVELAGNRLPKFRPGGLQIVHAGGDAGLFSAVLGGWVGGPKGSIPVARRIRGVPQR